MKYRSMKAKAITLMLAASMVVSMAACSSDTATDSSSDSSTDSSADTSSDSSSDGSISGSITVWSSLSQEEMDMYAEIYNSINPDVEVTNVAVDGDTYTTKLQATFLADSGAPDVALLEITVLGAFSDSGFLENLSADPYNADDEEENMIPYVAELCKDDDGNFVGLSYQSTPGGFWYNKELALEYLGTDDPDEVSALVSTWDDIADLGASVYEQSGGSVALLDSMESVYTPFLMNDGEALVSDDGVLVDFTEIFEIAVDIRESNADAKLEA